MSGVQQYVVAHGPAPKAWMALVVAEAKMVIRDTAGLLIPIGLPLLILVMYGIGDTGSPAPGGRGRTVFDTYVIPMVLAMVVATVGVINMPSFLAAYRHTGVLRRLAVTPASAGMVLFAQVVVSVIQTVVGVALALFVAKLGFGANLPADPARAIAVFALVAAAMYAVGLLVAALAPTPNSAVAIGLVLFFAMGALGGMFGSTDNLPGWLGRLGELLPYGAGVQAIGALWAGLPIEALYVWALLAALVIGGLGAVRFFRWD